jgi:hypothetical protein
MIWLTAEEHQIVLQHPLLQQATALAKELAERARALGTVDAINAATRAAEAEYWLAVDLSHQTAEIGGRQDACS